MHTTSLRNMISKLMFLILMTPNLLVYCTSAAVHSHGMNQVERESDGAYRPRDHDHYSDSEHNTEFDHEAIIGSVREAEEFDKLPPEESKKRLSKLLPMMDLNKNNFIEKDELKQWILKSFRKLSQEEADERMSESDDNQDGVVTWSEYLRDAFGVDNDIELGPDDTSDTGMLVMEEKAMWNTADSDGDGKLNKIEFEIFTTPEDHEIMHSHLINQTLREKDLNKDGFIDFEEYLGDRASQQDEEWLISEKDKFEHDLDINSDGTLDLHEIKQWVVPDNDEIADEETEHLFESADDNRDGLLSYDEILKHYDVFVGSEATAHGDQLSHHFEDEL